MRPPGRVSRAGIRSTVRQEFGSGEPQISRAWLTRARTGNAADTVRSASRSAASGW